MGGSERETSRKLPGILCGESLQVLRHAHDPYSIRSCIRCCIRSILAQDCGPELGSTATPEVINEALPGLESRRMVEEGGGGNGLRQNAYECIGRGDNEGCGFVLKDFEEQVRSLLQEALSTQEKFFFVFVVVFVVVLGIVVIVHRIVIMVVMVMMIVVVMLIMVMMVLTALRWESMQKDRVP